MPLLTPHRERNLVLPLTAAATGLLLLLTFDVAADYQALFFGPFILTMLALVTLTLRRLVQRAEGHSSFPTTGLAALLGLSLLTGLCYGWYHGTFYGRKVLSGVFIDDRSRLDLTLYEDGRYLIEEGWMLGTERFTGHYFLRGDSIILAHYSFTHEATDQVLIRRGNRLYLPRPDTSFYHFKIQP